MAYRDYILCKTCHCKIVYDGSGNGRNRLQEYWGNPEADEWTVGLLCPDCIKELETAVAAEREACASMLENNVDLSGLASDPALLLFVLNVLDGCAAFIRARGEK